MPDYYYFSTFGVDTVAMEQEDSVMVLRLSAVSNMLHLLYNHLHCNTNLRGSKGE